MTALAPVRLTLRLHRFEALAFGGLVLVALALALAIAARLDTLASDPECLGAASGGVVTPRCQLASLEFGDLASKAGYLATVAVVAPFLAALLIGVAVVGRELERGTTRLAWALSPSRGRWLAHRLLPALALVTILALASAVATDRLLGATHGIDPGATFAEFGFHGPVLAARAVWVFGVAVVVGAVLGRALPALIVAGLIVTIGIVGGTNVHDRILRAEAVVIDETQMSAGDRWMDQRFRLPDGSLIGWEDIERYDPQPAEFTENTVWPTLPQVTLGIRAARYGEVSLREVGALAGGLLVCVGATAFVVTRRRPA